MVVACAFQGPLVAGDVPANLAAIEAAARTAGADILISPEMSVTGYNIGSQISQLAEPADGPIAESVADIARRTGTAIVYGYPESNTAGLPFNAVQAVDAAGRRLANYRKTHLYGSDKQWFAPGDTWTVQFDFAGLRCGLLICYDVEFPENVRAHAAAGTKWLLVPTALMAPFDFVAEKLVPVRAYESQLLVTYANRNGTEGGLTYCGKSCTVAPDGSELGRAGPTSDVLITQVDSAELPQQRALNSYLADRRLDLYRTSHA